MKKVDNYLELLNSPQKQAVECIEGPLMIIAGAGSGKTRVLTYRIAHLIRSGVDPFNILALTFTNKAAKEMKERIKAIVGNAEARNIWMGTFHAVFARILRAEHEKLGYPANFTIYDTDDSKSLIRTILKEQGLDEKVYKPSLVLSRISNAKNNLINPIAYGNNHQISEDDKASGKPKLGLVYQIYNTRLFKSGAMDFDDLLFNTNILLRDYADVLFKYQDKFRYILVDEYQDTNFSQYLIVKQLAARFRNICVVGDDAQSIYAFRGANIQNILNFEKDYPELNTFKLEQNYRSTQNIVDAANSIIKNNKDQIQKKVWTGNAAGDKIMIRQNLSDNEEGYNVASEIFFAQQNERANNKQFAVLYRTNAQSRAIEEALRKKNIPYKIYGGLSFYQRKEIKDLLAYFRLSINLNDEEALKRIINYPARGIGETTFNKIIFAANDQGLSIWTVLENLSDFNLDIAASAKSKINDFVAMIKSFATLINVTNAYDAAEHIASSTTLLKELYNDKTPEGVSRYENIQELLNGIKEFVESDKAEGEMLSDDTNLNTSQLQENTALFTDDEIQNLNKSALFDPEKTLPYFMQDIALLTDADNDNENESDVVSLMTIHASKGLEFPYVFIVGMEENLFPSQLSLNSRAELEEERRLFYVALTRAEKKAFLSYAVSRYRWGNLISNEPSRFLEEIDPAHVLWHKSEQLGFKKNSASKQDADVYSFPKPFAKKSAPAQQGTAPSNRKLVKITGAVNNSSSRNSENIEVVPGAKVVHERFGKGIVISVEGIYPNNNALIDFEKTGKKKLLLKFAKLKIE